MTDQPGFSDGTNVNAPQTTDETKQGISAQDANSKSETDGQDTNSDFNRQPELTQRLIIAEYTNLTNKLNNRQNIRYQMIQFALAALATLLTVSSVGIQNHLDSLILAYPVLVLVLSIIYTSNAYEARRIQNYIKTRIEIFLPDQIGWYGYRHSGESERLEIVGNMGAKTVFIVTAIVAIFIGIQIMHQDKVSEVLLRVAAGVTIILTILLSFEGFVYELARKWRWIEQPIEKEP